MTRTIYYVGEFQFPEGEAASFRVLGNVKALRSSGFEVVVVGLPKVTSPPIAQLDPANLETAAPYYLVDEYGRRTGPRWKRVWRYALGGARLTSWLKTHASDEAAAVILAGGYTRYQLRLLPLTRRWGIPLITDVMEWFEPEHCLGGRFGPQRCDVELTLRYFVPKARHAIAISSFLERHFVARGSAVVRVPPLVDLSDRKWERNGTGAPAKALRLGFVGNSGKKDLLVNAVRAMVLAGDSVADCQLFIVGPSREEVARDLGPDADLLRKLEPKLHFAGRLPHREALRWLQQIDFSVLLRPDLRFAHAGFPTKLVESLAMGVPVICNLTSDIGLYVRDGEEGLVVRGSAPEAFAQGLRRAVGLSAAQREVMRQKARLRAESSFDYRSWIEPLGDFVNRVIQNYRSDKRWLARS